jgi:hypothetical protein
MRKNSRNTLRLLAVGCTVASLGTAASLYATPVASQQTVATRSVIDTVPTKDTARPKPDTAMPTLPKPDTAKPKRDTTKPPTATPTAAVKP